MGVVIPDPIRLAIEAHARACLPEECCGLLAFDASGGVRFAYPLTNADHSPTSFTVEPTEHFAAIGHAERNGWEIAGVFHSHPTTRPEPSTTDIERAPDPDWLHLLVGFDRGGGAHIRAFRIAGGVVSEQSIVDDAAGS